MSSLGEAAVRIGVLGFGRMGALHAGNTVRTPGARLAAICDVDADARLRASGSHAVPVFERIDEFLAADLDAVIISSSTQCHSEQVQLCAEAGVAVFTEKPVGLSMAEATAALVAVERSGVAFQIGYQRRWDPAYAEMKSLVDDGAIGRPVFFRAFGRDPDASSVSKWGLDKNGGIFLNCAIHDYDIARFLFGSEVATVSASGAVAVHSGLQVVGDLDACSTTLKFAGGEMAVTEWTRFSPYGFSLHAELIGTDGVLELGSSRFEGLTLRRRAQTRTAVVDRFEHAFRASLEAFVESVREGRTPIPGRPDALASLQIALAARQSYENGSIVTDVGTFLSAGTGL